MNSALWRGRLTVALAATLWSLSGFFVKILTHPPAWTETAAPVAPAQIACWRCLFGALSLLPLLRLRDVRWHPLMLVMSGCFAVMNGLFITAMSTGGAAEASLLQYTAPFWVFLVNVWLLGRDRALGRDWLALAIAMLGIVLIVIGGLQHEQFQSACLALGAGVAFAGVLISFGLLSQFASPWLAFLNQLVAGLIALPWALQAPWPQGSQWILLALFGTIQVALPNWLMSRAMKSVPVYEAALITLLDPVLSPVWAFLVIGEIPPGATIAGGGIFLLALINRYWPFRSRTAL